ARLRSWCGASIEVEEGRCSRSEPKAYAESPALVQQNAPAGALIPPSISALVAGAARAARAVARGARALPEVSAAGVGKEGAERGGDRHVPTTLSARARLVPERPDEVSVRSTPLFGFRPRLFGRTLRRVDELHFAGPLVED